MLERKGKKMKIKISIPDTYMVADMPEKKAREIFWKMSEMMRIMARPESEKEAEKKEVSPAGAEAGEDMEALAERPKYKGFMYIKCPKCGEVKSFFTRNETDHYHCDNCGERTEFEAPLSLLWINCECGSNVRYFTNRTEPNFDIPCFKCGSPVAVEWNDKKSLYTTMKN